MTVRHVVLLRLSAEASPEQRTALARGLDALPGAIPGVRAYHHGADLHLAEGNDHYAIVADFDDQQAYEVYRDHPAHQRLLADLLRPILEHRSAVQFEITGEGSGVG